MKIAILAKGRRGDAVVEAVRTSNHDLTHVIYHDASIDDAYLKTILTADKPDVLVLAGWSHMVPSNILEIPKHGTINLHGGRLPEYRGASVLNWQIIEGERWIGLSILYAVPDEVDAGDILAEEEFPLLDDMMIDDVVEMSLRRFPKMLLKVLNQMEHDCLEPRRWNFAEDKVWPHRGTKDSLLDFGAQDDIGCRNFIRALAGRDYPPAFAYGRGRRFCFWRSKQVPLEGDMECQPGRFLARWPGHGILVGTRNRPLLITEMWNEELGEAYAADLIDLKVGTLFSLKPGV